MCRLILVVDIGLWKVLDKGDNQFAKSQCVDLMIELRINGLISGRIFFTYHVDPSPVKRVIPSVISPNQDQ